MQWVQIQVHLQKLWDQEWRLFKERWLTAEIWEPHLKLWAMLWDQ
jgi:hypothetical protein